MEMALPLGSQQTSWPYLIPVLSCPVLSYSILIRHIVPESEDYVFIQVVFSPYQTKNLQ